MHKYTLYNMFKIENGMNTLILDVVLGDIHRRIWFILFHFTWFHWISKRQTSISPGAFLYRHSVTFSYLAARNVNAPTEFDVLKCGSNEVKWNKINPYDEMTIKWVKWSEINWSSTK